MEQRRETARHARLGQLIETFLVLSSAVPLSRSEERALLDVTAAELASLRLPQPSLDGMNIAKLQRRVDYAIPLLRRMLAASLA